jgi:hypothetical protein
MPAGPRTKYLKYPGHEPTVVRSRSANILHSTRKRVLDSLPLAIAQLISNRHTITATFKTDSAKSISGYRLEAYLPLR